MNILGENQEEIGATKVQNSFILLQVRTTQVAFKSFLSVTSCGIYFILNSTNKHNDGDRKASLNTYLNVSLARFCVKNILYIFR